jgi:hypothetical protein
VELDFEHVFLLNEAGGNPTATHLTKERWWPFTVLDGYMAVISTLVPFGLWRQVEDAAPLVYYSQKVVEDAPITELSAYRFSGDPTWLTWHWDVPGQDEDEHRIMLVPGPDLVIRASPTDEGPFGMPYPVHLERDGEIARIKRFIPLYRGEDSGGYVFRLKLEGFGRVIVYEAGFEFGIRGG